MFFPGSPLNYPVNSVQPIRRYRSTRAPTVTDIKNFIIGDEWLDITTNTWYKLSDKSNGVALWCVLCGGGGVGQPTTFLPNSGVTPVVRDGNGQIALQGDNGVTTVGDLSLMTWNLTGSFEGDWEFTCPADGATWKWNCTEMCTEFRGRDVGFTGSDWITCQSSKQTIDENLTAIALIPLNDLRAISLRATFVGARSDHTAALTGTIVYGARRSGGVAIEMGDPVANVIDDGNASVTIDASVSGNDVELQVAGEVATTWNWVVTYEYKILNTEI